MGCANGSLALSANQRLRTAGGSRINIFPQHPRPAHKKPSTQDNLSFSLLNVEILNRICHDGRSVCLHDEPLPLSLLILMILENNS